MKEIIEIIYRLGNIEAKLNDFVFIKMNIWDWFFLLSFLIGMYKFFRFLINL